MKPVSILGIEQLLHIGGVPGVVHRAEIGSVSTNGAPSFLTFDQYTASETSRCSARRSTARLLPRRDQESASDAFPDASA